MHKPLGRLLRKARRGDLADALADTVDFAHRARLPELGKWARLELHGFFDSNSAMDQAVQVPAYRTVAGQWMDLNYRVLILRDAGLSFVNEFRLRLGILELEEAARAHGVIALEVPELADTLRRDLGVEVHYFTFSAMAARSVLHAIRTQLEDRLRALDTVPDLVPEQPGSPVAGEILILRPAIYGLGLDLRALWRRLIHLAQSKRK